MAQNLAWFRLRSGRIIEHRGDRDDQGMAMPLGWARHLATAIAKALLITMLEPDGGEETTRAAVAITR